VVRLDRVADVGLVFAQTSDGRLRVGRAGREADDREPRPAHVVLPEAPHPLPERELGARHRALRGDGGLAVRLGCRPARHRKRGKGGECRDQQRDAERDRAVRTFVDHLVPFGSGRVKRPARTPGVARPTAATSPTSSMAFVARASPSAGSRSGCSTGTPTARTSAYATSSPASVAPAAPTAIRLAGRETRTTHRTASRATETRKPTPAAGSSRRCSGARAAWIPALIAQDAMSTWCSRVALVTERPPRTLVSCGRGVLPRAAIRQAGRCARTNASIATASPCSSGTDRSTASARSTTRPPSAGTTSSAVYSTDASFGPPWPCA